MERLLARTIVAAVAVAALACGKSDREPGAAGEGEAEKAEAASEKAKAGEKAADAERGRKPAEAGERDVTKLSASHILVMHKDSKRPRAGANRTREEAKARIEEVAKKLAEGADFADLAREYSDCPSGERKGGDLGIFPAFRMVPEFSEATKKLGIGEVSGPVETPFGFHIIKRQEVEEVHARHILLMHDQSKRRLEAAART